jgi:hypothetical protein
LGEKNLKELKKLTFKKKKKKKKKTNNPIKIWGIELNRAFTTEESQMAEKYSKKC